MGKTEKSDIPKKAASIIKIRKYRVKQINVTDSQVDITVFDPETIIDRATYTDPHNFPEGVPYVIVNGQVVVEKGEHTGILAGKVLRKQVYTMGYV